MVMSWQIKGWLWLAAALVAATLAAGTSGAAPDPATHAAAVGPPCSSTTVTGQSDAESV
jgi:hypothetical protein